jgi:ATP-dependent DNA helicase RecG
MQKTLATDSESKSVVVRLKTMESTTDGFQIAEVDLQLRGPGDILGKQQSGLPPFKYINLAYDGEIISTARKVAFEILTYDPNFTKHQKLKKFLDLKMTDKNYFGVG